MDIFENKTLGIFENKAMGISHRIEFSVNHRTYEDIIFPYSGTQQSIALIERNINEFIESCLSLGNFLYELDKIDSSINRLIYCVFNFPINGYYSPTNKVTIEAQIGGYVDINIHKSSRIAMDDSNVYIQASIPFSDNFLKKLNFRREWDNNLYPKWYRYTIDKAMPFIKPPLYKMPLYINTPFLKEYAKYAYEHPKEFEPISYGPLRTHTNHYI
jgi:hypothetical protein